MAKQVKTIYTCDFCKEEVDPSRLFSVEVKLNYCTPEIDKIKKMHLPVAKLRELHLHRDYCAMCFTPKLDKLSFQIIEIMTNGQTE